MTYNYGTRAEKINIILPSAYKLSLHTISFLFTLYINNSKCMTCNDGGGLIDFCYYCFGCLVQNTNEHSSPANFIWVMTINKIAKQSFNMDFLSPPPCNPLLALHSPTLLDHLMIRWNSWMVKGKLTIFLMT